MPRRTAMAHAAAALLAIALAMGVAACGKKARLEPPEGARTEFPRFYPEKEALPPRQQPPAAPAAPQGPQPDSGPMQPQMPMPQP